MQARPQPKKGYRTHGTALDPFVSYPFKTLGACRRSAGTDGGFGDNSTAGSGGGAGENSTAGSGGGPGETSAAGSGGGFGERSAAGTDGGARKPVASSVAKSDNLLRSSSPIPCSPCRCRASAEEMIGAMPAFDGAFGRPVKLIGGGCGSTAG